MVFVMPWHWCAARRKVPAFPWGYIIFEECIVMPTINLTPYFWKTLVPMLLKIVAPTLILVIIFGIIKIILSRIIKDRTPRILIGTVVNIFFIISIVVVDAPLTQQVIKSLKYTPPDYDIFSKASTSSVRSITSSKVTASNKSSVTTEDYFAPFFEAFEKEWERMEEDEKQNKEKSENSSQSNAESAEDKYEEFKKWVEELWNEQHPDHDWSEEEYQEFLRQAEKLWNTIQKDLPDDEP